MGRLVIALGGNALLEKGQKGTAEEQMKAAEKAVFALEDVFFENQVVLTHGNGPQVGNLLLQQEATDKVEKMPLDVLDAMTQGQIGYFICRALSKLRLHSATLITRVVIDPEDPAFNNPSKPIGPFYDKPMREGMVEDAGRGYRLVVPSPTPMKIREHDAISALLERGFTVTAVGGGGIPIKKTGQGVEAVIDKDRASSLLATQINADTFLVVTSVDAVFLNFGKPTQEEIKKMSVPEAERYIAEGHFAEGSMKPKIESCVEFIRKGGKKAAICSMNNIRDALEGKAGTTITP
ncbi:MAG: carbamate kinase [Candidatus Micrarchaeota archaeon]